MSVRERNGQTKILDSAGESRRMTRGHEGGELGFQIGREDYLWGLTTTKQEGYGASAFLGTRGADEKRGDPRDVSTVWFSSVRIPTIFKGTEAAKTHNATSYFMAAFVGQFRNSLQSRLR